MVGTKWRRCVVLTFGVEGEVVLRAHKTVQSRPVVFEYTESDSGLLWGEDQEP